MVRARLVVVLACISWSLVGCQILARSAAPGSDAWETGAASHDDLSSADADADFETQADEAPHTRPWSVAWVRHGGDDLFVDAARGVVLSGGTLYDQRGGLYRGRVGRDVAVTLPDGRAVVHEDGAWIALGFDDALTGDRAELGDAPRDAVAGHPVATRLLAGGRAFAAVEIEDDVATLVVRATSDLSRTLEIPLPGAWTAEPRPALAQAADGRLLISLPQGAHLTPQIAAADVDGSLVALDLPFEGAALTLSDDGSTIAIDAGDDLELRDLDSGALLRRFDGLDASAVHLAADGSALAVVSGGDAARLQVWRADAQRRDWTRTFEGAAPSSRPRLAFAADGATLWMADRELVALRPGASRQRAPMDYGVALPSNFGARDEDVAATAGDAGLATLAYGARSETAPTVWVTAHDRRTYAPVGDDLLTWSTAVLGSLQEISTDELGDPTLRHTAVRMPDGSRATEVVVPACRHADGKPRDGRGGDLYVHVRERGDQLIEVAMLAPRDASSEEIAALYTAFVETPLGQLPDGEALVAAQLDAPTRECGR